jgi:tripartite-type tricarboxylate transporter receptor subunit TctC
MQHLKKMMVVVLGILVSIQTVAQTTATKGFLNRSIRVVVPYVAGGPMDFIKAIEDMESITGFVGKK